MKTRDTSRRGRALFCVCLFSTNAPLLSAGPQEQPRNDPYLFVIYRSAGCEGCHGAVVRRISITIDPIVTTHQKIERVNQTNALGESTTNGFTSSNRKRPRNPKMGLNG